MGDGFRKSDSLRNHYYDLAANSDLDLLLKVLPSNKFDNYESLMKGIIIKFERQISDCEKELEITTDPEDRQIIQSMIDDYVARRDICKDLLNGIKEEELPKGSFKLIFAHDGKCFENDLKDIEFEVYEYLIKLLQLLESNPLELDKTKFNEAELKRMNGNHVRDLFEIKNDQSRIVFRYLKGNRLYVMLAATKKGTSDKYFTSSAVLRKKLTLNEYERIRKLLEDPDKAQEIDDKNTAIRDNIMNLLDSKKRTGGR